MKKKVINSKEREEKWKILAREKKKSESGRKIVKETKIKKKEKKEKFKTIKNW